MLITNRIQISTAAQGAKTKTYLAEGSSIRNKGYLGFKLTVNIKNTGSGTLTPSVNEYDDSGNITKTWATGALAVSSGITILEVYPALTPAGNAYNDILGALFNATMTISSGGSVTFDAVLDLIP